MSSAATVSHIAQPRTERKVLYGVAIFLSAFLLFQAQLLMGKFLLPWFGGTAAVWATCMLFYQLVLLGGYAYAHGLAARLTRKQQGELHIALLLAAVLVLGWNSYSWGSPLLPDGSWRPTPNASPVMHIILLLTMAVGIPLFLLSSTAPLLQSWYGQENRRPPYFLYALSNTGSLLGLLSYPTLAEPWLRVRTQAIAWSCGFAIFGLICALCAYRGRFVPEDLEVKSDGTAALAPTRGRMLMWFALSACGSFLLLATTNVLTQDLAPIPLLWVVPLCIYLLTFIVAFERERWYVRNIFHALMLVSAFAVVYTLHREEAPGLPFVLLILSGWLFAACMVCHGELARSKPAAMYLTSFYLIISAGGATGGLLVSIVAPTLFNANLEFPIGVFAVLALAFIGLALETASWVRRSPGKSALAALGLVAAIGYLMLGNKADDSERVLQRSRNFYGALRVVSKDEVHLGQKFHNVNLMHGNIMHGTQMAMPGWQGFPTAYFAPNSGAALAIATQARSSSGPIRVGVVGLGIGTLAAYARPGDYYRFYEINSKVADYAAGEGGYFSFLTGSAGRVDVVIGDARLSMEGELKVGEAQKFDVLLIDAFNGDAIPIHLLTKEAMSLYRKHLRGPNSIIGIHISNRYVDLEPVVAGIAGDLHLNARTVRAGEHQWMSLGSWWVLLSEGSGLNADEIMAASTSARRRHELPAWTDDFSNLVPLLISRKR